MYNVIAQTVTVMWVKRHSVSISETALTFFVGIPHLNQFSKVVVWLQLHFKYEHSLNFMCLWERTIIPYMIRQPGDSFSVVNTMTFNQLSYSRTDTELTRLHWHSTNTVALTFNQHFCIDISLLSNGIALILLLSNSVNQINKLLSHHLCWTTLTTSTPSEPVNKRILTNGI